MNMTPQLKCIVSFKKHNGNIDCRTVLMAGETPQDKWLQEAKQCLFRQHDIYNAAITNMRLCFENNTYTHIRAN